MDISTITEKDISNAYYAQPRKQYTIEELATALADATAEEIQKLLATFQNAHTFVELTNLLVNNPSKDPSKQFSRVGSSLKRGTDHIYDWSHLLRRTEHANY